MPSRLARCRPMAVSILASGFVAFGTMDCAAQGGIPGNSPREDNLLQYQALVNEGASRTVAQWEDAWRGGKAAALADLYLRSAMIITGTGTVINGQTALQAYFARNLSRLSDVRLKVYEVVGSGDLAYVTGYLDYDVKFGAGGSYTSSVLFSLAMLQQRDGAWRIRDQTGGDLPVWFVVEDSLRAEMAPGESDTIRVRLSEAGGKPLPHAEVTFQVTHGGGSVTPLVAFTDSSGAAAAVFSTGPQPGINVVLARAAVLPNEPLGFHVITERQTAREGNVGSMSPWPARP